MWSNHGRLGRDKVGIIDLGLLISLYQNDSGRVLRNCTKTSVLFFKRLQA